MSHHLVKHLFTIALILFSFGTPTDVNAEPRYCQTGCTTQTACDYPCTDGESITTCGDYGVCAQAPHLFTARQTNQSFVLEAERVAIRSVACEDKCPEGWQQIYYYDLSGNKKSYCQWYVIFEGNQEGDPATTYPPTWQVSEDGLGYAPSEGSEGYEVVLSGVPGVLDSRGECPDGWESTAHEEEEERVGDCAYPLFNGHEEALLMSIIAGEVEGEWTTVCHSPCVFINSFPPEQPCACPFLD